MNTSVVDIVKHVAAIHHSIFLSWEEHEPRCCPIVALNMTTPDPANDVTVYTPVFDYDKEPVPIHAACPADMPEPMKRALTVWNECDIAVQTLLPSLHIQISASVPGARVEWLNVEIEPVFVFNSPHSFYYPTHSAFLIVLPGEGGEFVADFTIEQFGYGRDRWFLPLEEYMDMTRDGILHIFDYKERAEVLQEAFKDAPRMAQEAMRRLCEEMDWAVVKQMPESEREAVINEMVRRALSET